MISNVITWQEQAYEYIVKNEYAKAANFYEKAIVEEPCCFSNYWYLGLVLLLQGQETEAQMTWMLPMAEVEEEEYVVLKNELIQVLQIEAERRESLREYSLAWVIRQHIREIDYSNINNLLKLIQTSIKSDNFHGDEVIYLGIIDLLNSGKISDLNSESLLEVLGEVLNNIPLQPMSLKFTEACIPYLSNPEKCLSVMLPAAMKIGHTLKRSELAAKILELFLKLDCKNQEALRHLAIFYQDSANHSQGIETAKLCYSLSEILPDKIFAIHLVLRGLMNAGGYWDEVCLTSEELKSLLREFVQAEPLLIEEGRILRLLTPCFAIPHIQDNPVEFRSLLNQITNIFQDIIQGFAIEKGKSYSLVSNNKFKAKSNTKVPTVNKKPLRIGYLSYAFRQHSVGWLARWLLHHHDQKEFEVHGYFVNYRLADDFLQNWYVNNIPHSHKFGFDAWEIADQIYQDEIDILVDLDSITLDLSCEIMALKPAPVQVTWLGWDASGIPAIDYYIADPYVLPASAQDYYTEKIWRLPNTYIAVDGFEVGVPTLRRDDLNIPSDAVVYLSAQRGYKRHPETIRWQMRIIKEVPNSYFLIKGLSEEESIKRFFYGIAEEEGVDCDRLKFLPIVASEAVHRANLGIADVVLDTYPYNGATTTLETLWMCIPLVTRVGEQFAARNSYTMMMNAGITEGIAWTNEEYIEWGVRLGKDAKLRQEIGWKLRQSRQTAPLWNGKQFTREMEKAYEQMWDIYRQGRE